MPTLERQQNVKMHYAVDGDGDIALLLLNGASLPLEFWGDVASRLAERFRVVRFDARNAGKTEFAGAFTLNDIAADAMALLDHLQIEEAVVIGHAWGGRVAQVIARDYPHRVSHLVICGTGGQFPPADTKALDGDIRDARRAGDRERWAPLIESRWCGEGFAAREPERFAAMTDMLWNNRPNRDARWDMRVSPSASYWGFTDKPTLMLYGDQDKNGTPENASDLESRLPDVRLVMIEGVGHFLVLEAMDTVVDEIATFINR